MVPFKPLTDQEYLTYIPINLLKRFYLQPHCYIFLKIPHFLKITENNNLLLIV